MADIRKIKVMISSRSLTRVFDACPLKEVRLRLQAFLQGIRWTGHAPGTGPSSASSLVGRDQALFDVWIHENDAGRAADKSTLAVSLEEIDKADIIVVLYTGEAGSVEADAPIGICHAELREALARRPEIVSIIGLEPLQPIKSERDRAFRRYIESQSLYRRRVDDEATLYDAVAELLQQRVSVLVRRGAMVGVRKRDRGPALDWNRLDLAARRDAMRIALARQLQAEEFGLIKGREQLHLVRLPDGQSVAARLDAIAAALTVAVARESVGQPFLRDHIQASTLKENDIPGVVHLIACHRGISESQAVRILGTPDAISVSSDFGVYIADHVQKIQLVFLAQCSDETSTALAVRLFREWLIQSGEGLRIVERSRSRRRIILAIANEQPESGEGRKVDHLRRRRSV
jgi:hypothetical protein